MKIFFALCLAFLAASAADAQVFRPQTGYRSAQAHAGSDHGHGYRNVGYGYGHSNGHHWHGGSGYYGRPYGYGYLPGYSYLPSYGYYGGYGYGYPYYGYGYGDPYYNNYGYYGSTPAATTGLVLGALAGGIIGHNSSAFYHNPWYGSMWGAGLGWLAGSAIDANRRPVAYAQTPVVVQQAPAVQSQPAAATQPQQVTITNHYYNSSTPMGAANGMFGR